VTAALPASAWDNAVFWDGVDHGRLLLARCEQCAYLQHPPLPMCPRCGSVTWNVHESAGRGRLHSWIVSHHPSQLDADPRVVALVELEDGVRFVANLRGVPIAEIRNDMAVELVITQVGDVTLPQFTRAGEES
jgi:uncharacterized OB-fold protein